MVAPSFEQRSRVDTIKTRDNQRIEREILIDGSPTIFTAKWSAGNARVSLIDPSGQVFDPEFAAGIIDGEPLPDEPLSEELDPNMVIYESDDLAASYHFLAPRPGLWKLIVEADANMPNDTELETNVNFNSDFGLNFVNEFPFFLANDKTQVKVISNLPILNGSGEAKIRRFDGVIDTVALTLEADGSFAGTYPIPDAPGIAEVSWFVIGTNSNGLPFERAGSDTVQIGRRSILVTSVGAETAVPSPLDPRNYSALEVPINLQSEYVGNAMVAADLVDVEGNVVANATQTDTVFVGANQVKLRFSGEDLFANRRNGPYRLTNLITLDQRDDDLLSDWQLDQLNTAAYDYRQFGPPTPGACNTKNVLLGATATASSTHPSYSPLRTVDGNRNTALGGDYSWSNSRETDTTPALPASLQIGLTEPRVVDQILIHSTADWEIRDYDLEYFDGTSWDTIERVRDNTQTVREHRIPSTQIHALRVVGFSGPDHQTVHVRINEIEAYECNRSIEPIPIADAKPLLR